MEKAKEETQGREGCVRQKSKKIEKILQNLLTNGRKNGIIFYINIGLSLCPLARESTREEMKRTFQTVQVKSLAEI